MFAQYVGVSGEFAAIGRRYMFSLVALAKRQPVNIIKV